MRKGEEIQGGVTRVEDLTSTTHTEESVELNRDRVREQVARVEAEGEKVL